MAVISVILVVLFVILSIFLVGLVLLQNGEGEGLGGLFAGGSNSAFGSRSASVLAKVTYVCVGLFFVVAFFLALVNRTPSDRGFREEVQMQRATETRENWWADDQSGADSAAIEEADEGGSAIEEAGAGGSVIEEADDGALEDGITRPEDADEVVQSPEITLPEQAGEVLQDAEIDTIEDTDAALRPD